MSVQFECGLLVHHLSQIEHSLFEINSAFAELFTENDFTSHPDMISEQNSKSEPLHLMTSEGW